ncbi:30S ribosomal protein S8 [Candidatus Kaiserbacteria bacterium]|nr:30S ribosomal protein S8 [Candidatus Kaiserbacteria bacterium]
MVNDPVADLIVRLQNAAAVHKPSVSVPFSNFKMAVAEALKGAGYVKAVEKRGKKVKRVLDIMLSYDEAGRPAISGVKRISKPGRRVYRGARELYAIRYGHGMLVLSTPKGVMTNADARKHKVGGEALFEVW